MTFDRFDKVERQAEFTKAIIMDSPKIIMAIQLLLELGFLLHQIFTEMFQNPKPYLEHAIIYLTLHIE